MTEAELEVELDHRVGCGTPTIDVIHEELHRQFRAGAVLSPHVAPRTLGRIARQIAQPLEAAPCGRVFIRFYSAIGWVKIYEDLTVGDADGFGRVRFRPDPAPEVPARPEPIGRGHVSRDHVRELMHAAFNHGLEVARASDGLRGDTPLARAAFARWLDEQCKIAGLFQAVS